jgi:hypothetical protein
MTGISALRSPVGILARMLEHNFAALSSRLGKIVQAGGAGRISACIRGGKTQRPA